MDVVGIVLKVVVPPTSHSSSSRPIATDAKVKPGDRVMATLIEVGGTGGLSEIVLAPLKHVFPVPTMASTENSLLAGAAFANIGRNYFAAYHSLVEVGRIEPLSSSSSNNAKYTNSSTIVLVTGASGGVGMATIELAKAMGCIVVAGVGSFSKKTGPDSVGADAVFCYGRTKPERKAFRKEVARFCKQRKNSRGGVDLVVDVVMGDLFDDALVGCLKPLGTIALVGFAAGQRPIRPGILLVKEARVAGSLWGSVAAEANEDGTTPNKYSQMVENILGYLSDGSITGRVDRIVPVSRFIEAFEVFEENKGRGNTVISFVDEKNGSRRRSLL
jgi:NADPH2:quinone reductase